MSVCLSVSILCCSMVSILSNFFFSNDDHSYMILCSVLTKVETESFLFSSLDCTQRSQSLDHQSFPTESISPVQLNAPLKSTWMACKETSFHKKSIHQVLFFVSQSPQDLNMLQALVLTSTSKAHIVSIPKQPQENQPQPD